MNARRRRWQGIVACAGAIAFSVGCAAGVKAAELVLHAPPEDFDAEVYVDGHYVGQVGAIVRPGERLRLAPGVHRVEVRKSGRFPLQRTVEVARRPPPQVDVKVRLPEDPR